MYFARKPVLQRALSEELQTELFHSKN